MFLKFLLIYEFSVSLFSPSKSLKEKKANFSCRVSLILNFDNCFLGVSFNVCVCLLYFLKTGHKIKRLGLMVQSKLGLFFFFFQEYMIGNVCLFLCVCVISRHSWALLRLIILLGVWKKNDVLTFIHHLTIGTLHFPLYTKHYISRTTQDSCFRFSECLCDLDGSREVLF